MKLIFVGPQGSGKGTQAKKVAEKFSLCHISTGDLLRGVTGELKVEINAVMEKGELVGDELIVKILKEKLDSSECEKGFILDGFPRNLKQAEMLKGITEIDKVIEIAISDEESVRRISGRRGCGKCGAIFNVATAPRPKVEGVCDECGGELAQRKDDVEEALRERLNVYHEETEKVLRMYDFVKIDGEQSIEKVYEDVVSTLS
ncbi:nucleoside monophosphate kinase [Methanococcoides sp. SA1]|nr:nucleoside monophosphate kinase [Methanococcoides sp. SA1]